MAGPRGRLKRAVSRVHWGDVKTDMARVTLQIVFLANTTASMLHAIALTLVRLVFTRRRLLEWETAAATAARVFGPDTRTFVTRMSASPALALAIFIIVSAVNAGGAAGGRARSSCCGRSLPSSA